MDNTFRVYGVHGTLRICPFGALRCVNAVKKDLDRTLSRRIAGRGAGKRMRMRNSFSGWRMGLRASVPAAQA